MPSPASDSRCAVLYGRYPLSSTGYPQSDYPLGTPLPAPLAPPSPGPILISLLKAAAGAATARGPGRSGTCLPHRQAVGARGSEDAPRNAPAAPRPTSPRPATLRPCRCSGYVTASSLALRRTVLWSGGPGDGLGCKRAHGAAFGTRTGAWAPPRGTAVAPWRTPHPAAGYGQGRREGRDHFRIRGPYLRHATDPESRPRSRRVRRVPTKAEAGGSPGRRPALPPRHRSRTNGTEHRAKGVTGDFRCEARRQRFGGHSVWR